MTPLRRLLLAALLLVCSAAYAAGPIPGEPDTERRTRYTASAQTGPFAVAFDLYGDGTDYQNWVEVWVNGVFLAQSGNWTLTSTSGALGVLARPISDGQITFSSAQTGTVDIVGARRPRRTAQLPEGVAIPTRSTNQVLTDLWMTLRERWDHWTRAVRVPPGETAPVLPPAATRKNGFLAFDGAGNPVITSSSSSTWYSGSGTPSSGVGKDTDLYFRTTTADVYQKSGGSWSIIANIQGPTGPTGPPNSVFFDVDNGVMASFKNTSLAASEYWIVSPHTGLGGRMRFEWYYHALSGLAEWIPDLTGSGAGPGFGFGDSQEPLSTVDVHGSFGAKGKKCTSDCSADDRAQWILCDATNGTVTITIPNSSAANDGRWYDIKKIDASSNRCVISSNLIDGNPTLSLSSRGDARQLRSYGSDSTWYVF